MTMKKNLTDKELKQNYRDYKAVMKLLNREDILPFNEYKCASIENFRKKGIMYVGKSKCE